MPIFVVPDSNSEDSAPLRVREHGDPDRPGPYPHAGGRGGGPTSKPMQPRGRAVPLKLQTTAALLDIASDKSIPSKEKPGRMFAVLQQLQPDLVAEATTLIDHAKKANPEFSSMMAQIAEDLKFKLHTNIEDRQVLRDGNDYVVVGSVKGVARTSVKAATDYDGDLRQVKDLLRGTITVRNVNDMVTALEKVSRAAEIVSIKDNVTKPLDTEYRDINVLVRLKSGFLAEVQIISKPMLRAKMGLGHRLYEAWRVVAEETPAYLKLREKQRRLYKRAWTVSAMSAAFGAQLGVLIAQIRGGGG